MTSTLSPGDRVRVTWPVDLSTERGIRRLRPGMIGIVLDPAKHLPPDKLAAADLVNWCSVSFQTFAVRVCRRWIEEVS